MPVDRHLSLRYAQERDFAPVAHVPADTITFFPSTEAKTFLPPEWMALRVLHAGLAAALRKAFRVDTARELEVRLAGSYPVREYAFVPLVRAIHSRADERAKESSEHEAELRLEALRAIYELYCQSAPEDVPMRPDDLHVRILNRFRQPWLADNLYFGGDYGTPGILAEAIYGQIVPEQIVASTETLQLGDDVFGFLCWLGVADLPRLRVEAECNDRRFIDHVRSALSYPVTFEEKAAHADGELYRVTLKKVASIDNLKRILEVVDHHTILAWIASDERLERSRSHGDENAIMEVDLLDTRRSRRLTGHTLPSYANWLLEMSAWLPTTSGDKRAPNQCTLASSVPDDLKTIFPRPAINFNHEIFKALNIDKTRLRAALERVGVNPGIADLSWDEFYGLLLQLPARDPEGKTASSTYRVLVGSRLDGDEPTGKIRDQFLRDGKLLGRRGENLQYFPVRDLYYVDNAVLPDVLCRTLPLLELEPRRGAQKVDRLFGVRPLDSRKIQLVIEDYRSSPRETELSTDLESLKPVVYALRVDADSNGTVANRVKSLRIILCRSVRGKATIENQEIPISLSRDGELIVDGDTAYLIGEPEEAGPLLRNELIADAVGEILATISRVERGSDFARLASCLPSRRAALLERILGNAAHDLLERAKVRLETKVTEDWETEMRTPWTPPPPPGPVPTETKEAAANVDALGGVPLGMNHFGEVEVEEKAHEPSPPPRTIIRRVSATPISSSSEPRTRRLADAARCESIAFRFEEAKGQDRYPLLAAHLQGNEGYGCGILSFSTAKNRDEFQQCPDPSLVARFIEVKGSRAEKGKVELAGNELKAAMKHRERFHLYRVFETEESGNYEIVILQDPIATSYKLVYEIDPFRVPAATRWQVKPVGEYVDPAKREGSQTMGDH
jgi:hypothetical protein